MLDWACNPFKDAAFPSGRVRARTKRVELQPNAQIPRYEATLAGVDVMVSPTTNSSERWAKKGNALADRQGHTLCALRAPPPGPLGWRSEG